MIAIGVSASDTGAGKTVVTCAVARALANRGHRVGVMKPVETGADDLAVSDTGALMSAARTAMPLDVVRPYTYKAPVAPLVAARSANDAIDLTKLDRAQMALRAGADVVLVEGAGGLLVPITPEVDFARLFSRWDLHVLLVVPNRLGSINQALMALVAARSAKLRVLAIVLTDVAGASADAVELANAGTIAECSSGVPVLEFPWLRDPRDFDASARVAEHIGLIDVIVQRSVPA